MISVLSNAHILNTSTTMETTFSTSTLNVCGVLKFLHSDPLHPFLLILMNHYFNEVTSRQSKAFLAGFASMSMIRRCSFLYLVAESTAMDGNGAELAGGTTTRNRRHGLKSEVGCSV